MSGEAIDTGTGRRERLLAHAAGLVIAAAYLALLLATARDIGFARDEGFYFSASESYARWFTMLVKSPAQAVRKDAVDRHWEVNSEHPALMKSLFALSWIVFSQKLEVMDESTAFRLPGMLMACLLVYLVTLFGTMIGGLRVGVFASLALALMPRFFYHAHLDCFDVAMATMWFAVAAAFWRSLNSLPWAIASGVLFGLALETKLNAFFIPATLGVFWLARFARGFGFTGIMRERTGRGLVRFPPIPIAFFAMGVLGPLVFLALWPWVWYDTLARLNNYLGFHLHHAWYNIEYLGVTYFQPPFPVSYPFVMTLATMPLATLALAAAGMGERLSASVARWRGRWGALEPARREREESCKGMGLFLLLNMLVPILIIAHPQTPIFGGTKHWLPAWPFIALFAGLGFRLVSDTIGRLALAWSGEGGAALKKGAVAAGAGLLFLAAAGQQTAASHPFGLSHYTLPVGETPGSADAGMCRQFWGFTTGSALGWLNANVPRNGRVFFHDTAWDSYVMYHKEGKLRPDIQWYGGIEGSDVAMVHWEQHMSMYEYEIWTWMGSATPAHVVTHQGVTILPLYKLRKGQ